MRKIDCILKIPLNGKQIGDIVSLPVGYVRFLERKQQVERANEVALADLEKKKTVWKALEKESEKKALVVYEKLDKIKEDHIKLRKRVSQGIKLYETVSANCIVDYLKTQGVNIKKDQVKIKHAIKTLGAHEVLVHIYGNYQVNLKIEVLSEE